MSSGALLGCRTRSLLRHVAAARCRTEFWLPPELEAWEVDRAATKLLRPRITVTLTRQTMHVAWVRVEATVFFL
jgi:hypothetical protein